MPPSRPPQALLVDTESSGLSGGELWSLTRRPQYSKLGLGGWRLQWWLKSPKANVSSNRRNDAQYYFCLHLLIKLPEQHTSIQGMGPQTSALDGRYS